MLKPAGLDQIPQYAEHKHIIFKSFDNSIGY